MKNNFDLRKFLAENKNITEDKFADAAEEDLIQCVKNLANTRYINKVEAADEAIAIIKKNFLVNDDGEEMDEGSKAEHSPEEIAAIMSDPNYDGEHSSDFDDGEDLDEQLNEISPSDIQDIVHGILGTAVGTAAYYGIGKLIDALESGKWREEGIKIAKALRNLSKKKKNEELHTNEVKKK